MQGKGQPIREEGPRRHIIEKQGTPTMGGLLILIASVVSTLLWADLSNQYVWAVLLVTVRIRPARIHGRFSQGGETFICRCARRNEDPGAVRRRRLGGLFPDASAGAATHRRGSHTLRQGRAGAAWMVLHHLWRAGRGRFVQRGQSHRRTGRPCHRAGDDRGRHVSADRISGRQYSLRGLPADQLCPRHGRT